jgi:hypothetical protein
MQTLPPTEHHGEYVRDREQYADDLAEELFAKLLEAAREATSVDEIFEHVSMYLTPAQRERLKSLLLCHDYRSIGKLLCDVHEQLAHARASNVPAARRVLSDEVQ